MSDVEYRDVAGFPGYRVGNDGSVWTCRYSSGVKGQYGGTIVKMRSQWKKLKPYGKVRMLVCLGRDGELFTKSVARLVLEAFVCQPQPGMVARHYYDPTPANCNLWNLRWGTQLDNIADMVRHKSKRGERHCRAKLTNSMAAEIRRRAGNERVCDLAKEFGTSRQVISDVKRGKTYTD